MADVLFTDYRPFGGFQLSPTPVSVDEGDPETVIVGAVNESGLPNGFYRITELVLWKQDADKYMCFGLNLQGMPGEKVVKTAGPEAQKLNSSSGDIIIEVTDGTLVIDVAYEFPTQLGSGSGTIEQLFIWWERVI